MINEARIAELGFKPWMHHDGSVIAWRSPGGICLDRFRKRYVRASFATIHGDPSEDVDEALASMAAALRREAYRLRASADAMLDAARFAEGDR